MEVSIEFEEYRGETIYFISTPSDLPHLKLWLSKDLSLTRVKKRRGFVKKLDSAFKLVEKILNGEIREGISLIA